MYQILDPKLLVSLTSPGGLGAGLWPGSGGPGLGEGRFQGSQCQRSRAEVWSPSRRVEPKGHRAGHWPSPVNGRVTTGVRPGHGAQGKAAGRGFRNYRNPCKAAAFPHIAHRVQCALRDPGLGRRPARVLHPGHFPPSEGTALPALRLAWSPQCAPSPTSEMFAEASQVLSTWVTSPKNWDLHLPGNAEMPRK